MTTETMTTTEENWAPIIREELEAAGFKILTLAEHVTHTEASALMSDLSRQLKAMKA